MALFPKREIFKRIKKYGYSSDIAPQVRNILLNGPSVQERKLLWLEVSGARGLIRENTNYYSTLVNSSVSYEVYNKQIAKDINRTFPTEVDMHKQAVKQSLENVLQAYSIRNSNVGYCQGMNSLVGRMLSLQFSEEESFWLLAQIIEEYLPLDYFTVMNGVIIDVKVMEKLVEQYTPKLDKHIRSLGIDISILSIQWFV